MNKGLKALEKIETTFVYNKQRKRNCYAHLMHQSKVIEEYYKDYNIIKQELEQINNLKRQITDLKVANKDKYETIKAMKQELLEYNKLRNRFKVLYEKNQKLEKFIEWLKDDEGNLYIKPEMLDKLKELKLYKEK